MTVIDKLKEEYKNVRAVFGAFKCHLDAAIHKAEYVANTESTLPDGLVNPGMKNRKLPI